MSVAPLVTVVTLTSVTAYDSMCRDIALCESLAECKDIADKAAALKEYARRIHNMEAERRAANVRLIAERRYGELLKELARATPKEAGALGGNAKAGHVAPATAAGATLTPYAEALRTARIKHADALEAWDEGRTPPNVAA